MHTRNVYKLWKLYCTRCHETLNILNWEDRIPKNCKCGGMYFESMDSPAATSTAMVPAFERRVSSRNPMEILADVMGPELDITETRWPEYTGG